MCIRDSNPTRPWSDRELFAQALAHSPLNAPGAEQHQSDTNALILSRALRQVTGTSVPQMLNNRVFEPAKMSSSYFPNDAALQTELPSNGMTGITYPFSNRAPVCTVPGEAEGEVIPVEPTAVPKVSPSMLGGAGATVTTVSDLKNFYESYLSGAYGASSTDLITTLSALSLIHI